MGFASEKLVGMTARFVANKGLKARLRALKRGRGPRLVERLRVCWLSRMQEALAVLIWCITD